MRKQKLTAIEQAEKERKDARRADCRRAILQRVSAAPARIKDLDALGFEIQEINRELDLLMHKGYVRFDLEKYTYEKGK